MSDLESCSVLGLIVMNSPKLIEKSMYQLQTIWRCDTVWPGVLPQAWSQMRLILFKLLLYRHGNVLSVNCPKDILMNKYLLALNLDSDAVDGSPEHEDKQDAVVRNLV